MARGPTHRIVGALAGGAYTASRTRNQDSGARLIEIGAGLVGGYIGGTMADQLEPACGGYHRRSAHSLAAAGGLIWASGKLEKVCGQLRLTGNAVQSAGQAAAEARDPDPLGVALCQFAAGFLAGLLAGYLSHVALDGFTPAGLPIM